jgi:hypothetical protein
MKKSWTFGVRRCALRNHDLDASQREIRDNGQDVLPQWLVQNDAKSIRQEAQVKDPPASQPGLARRESGKTHATASFCCFERHRPGWVTVVSLIHRVAEPSWPD